LSALAPHALARFRSESTWSRRYCQRLAIGAAAHATERFGFLRLGVLSERRGWLNGGNTAHMAADWSARGWPLPVEAVAERAGLAPIISCVCSLAVAWCECTRLTT
jgi:hypothetical protein